MPTLVPPITHPQAGHFPCIVSRTAFPAGPGLPGLPGVPDSSVSIHLRLPALHPLLREPSLGLLVATKNSQGHTDDTVCGSVAACPHLFPTPEGEVPDGSSSLLFLCICPGPQLRTYLTLGAPRAVCRACAQAPEPSRRCIL